MTDLQSCFFCGTVQSVDAYPIVPSAFTSPEERPKHVSLCESCREKYAVISDHIADTVRSTDSDVEPARTDPSRPLHIGRGGTRDHGTEKREEQERNDTPVPNVDQVPETDEEPSSAVDAFFDGDGVQFDDSEPRDGPEQAFPDGYHKVLRWLSNRDFPIARTDVEEIVSSAYDLTRDDCSNAIDAAVERGVLREKHGQLLAGSED